MHNRDRKLTLNHAHNKGEKQDRPISFKPFLSGGSCHEQSFSPIHMKSTRVHHDQVFLALNNTVTKDMSPTGRQETNSSFLGYHTS